MDPHVVFDCQEIMPDRFALTIAAAARARALTRGAEPRLDLPRVSVGSLALREIAGSAFSHDELALFLPGSPTPARLSGPDPDTTELRGDRASSAASASASAGDGSLMMRPDDEEK
ncbi:DNA-directed RNA polymerase subunit omega [Rhizobium leguminosarum]|uniref:DNA-directed RNA polymerase subunit omega n=1 Tax=Rhizobium leguminosarum TaxID=384 RepID=UPI0015F99D81|nr:DNA-directed RNA polymerase subunit omega [Rhizobium leguminosarum]MBA9035959.1 DNA-directed RNA polymerase subunit omega [Rhizobium leguminosarum]